MKVLSSDTRRGAARVLQLVVHVGALAPLLWLVWAVPRGDLGGDPVKELVHFLGMGALRLLLLSLLISPASKWLRFKQLMRLRRPLGLWCFAWASLHFSVWLALDLAFSWRLIGAELVVRTYILLGFLSWLLLALLAVTSLPRLVRALGRRWKLLHRFVYLVALLVCIHFWWSVKSGWIEPAIYLALALSLLIVRVNGANWRPGFSGLR